MACLVKVLCKPNSGLQVIVVILVPVCVPGGWSVTLLGEGFSTIVKGVGLDTDPAYLNASADGASAGPGTHS